MNRSTPSPGAFVPGFTSRRRRGAALVETVLLMIVLIPLLLYAFFLMDAAYMKLDLQESVVSSVWDVSTLNGENDIKKERGRYREDTPEKRGEDPDPKPSTWKSAPGWEKSFYASRSSYSDHTSAFEDGAEPGSPGLGDVTRINGNHNHEKHHKIYFAAQYTYRFEESAGSDTQFKCSMEDDNSWALDPIMLPRFADTYSKGGAVRCDAKGFIYNYIIPEKLFTQFTDVNLSNLTKRAKDSDSHVYQGRGRNIVATEKGSVYFNTWALETGAPRKAKQSEKIKEADIGDRGGLTSYTNLDGNPFYERVVNMSTTSAIATYGAVTAASLQFTSTSQSQLKMTVPPGVGSIREVGFLPTVAGVTLVSRYQPQAPGQTKGPALDLMSNSKFESTPYRNANTKYQTAYNKRGLYYMGCKTEQKDGACP
ncbi:TadE/TadG family type IV pilus assembly protein [Melittangium boletus]|uniref:Uncharacterized protein n=1 Tax=Melittangium boletus DSM 14713 TaxID=1294270 RepID=A0A250IC83_9BACT|nr:hypothetical protein [Melittangium boletus]ATB29464.1 hypothetical protein MEBOL_002914 [Melittangium boletus DSM 14713]